MDETFAELRWRFLKMYPWADPEHAPPKQLPIADQRKKTKKKNLSDVERKRVAKVRSLKQQAEKAKDDQCFIDCLKATKEAEEKRKRKRCSKAVARLRRKLLDPCALPRGREESVPSKYDYLFDDSWDMSQADAAHPPVPLGPPMRFVPNNAYVPAEAPSSSSPPDRAAPRARAERPVAAAEGAREKAKDDQCFIDCLQATKEAEEKAEKAKDDQCFIDCLKATKEAEEKRRRKRKLSHKEASGVQLKRLRIAHAISRDRAECEPSMPPRRRRRRRRRRPLPNYNYVNEDYFEYDLGSGFLQHDYSDNVCGFSPQDQFELMCQGVKPWDDCAGAVMAALSGG
jgi:hypothetical protein